MAIGATRSTNYGYAGAVGALNGNFTAGTPGTPVAWTQNAGAQAGQSVVSYSSANGSGGTISIACDGVNAPAASVLQTALQALGTVNSMDISGTTVTLGTSFTVA